MYKRGPDSDEQPRQGFQMVTVDGTYLWNRLKQKWLPQKQEPTSLKNIRDFAYMAELQKGRTASYKDLFQGVRQTMVHFLGGIGNVDVSQQSLDMAFKNLHHQWFQTSNKWAGELIQQLRDGGDYNSALESFNRGKADYQKQLVQSPEKEIEAHKSRKIPFVVKGFKDFTGKRPAPAPVRRKPVKPGGSSPTFKPPKPIRTRRAHGSTPTLPVGHGGLPPLPSTPSPVAQDSPKKHIKYRPGDVVVHSTTGEEMVVVSVKALKGPHAGDRIEAKGTSGIKGPMHNLTNYDIDRKTGKPSQRAVAFIRKRGFPPRKVIDLSDPGPIPHAPPMPPLPASFTGKLPGKKPAKKPAKKPPPKPMPVFKPPPVPIPAFTPVFKPPKKPVPQPGPMPAPIPQQPPYAPFVPAPQAPIPQFGGYAPIPQFGGYVPTPAAARARRLRAGLEKPQRIRRQRFARPVTFLKTARKAEHARFTQPSKATALIIKKRKKSVFFKGVWNSARVASAIALYKLSKIGRKKYSLEELLKKVKAALDKEKGITLA